MKYVIMIVGLLTLVGCATTTPNSSFQYAQKSAIKTNQEPSQFAAGLEIDFRVKETVESEKTYQLVLRTASPNRVVRIQKVELANDLSLIVKNTNLKTGRFSWEKVGDLYRQEIDLGRKVLEIDQMARSGDFAIRVFGTVDGEEIKIDFAFNGQDGDYLVLGTD